MKYVKYEDYDGKLNEGECVLMSKAQFDNGGKDLIGVPVAITPDGSEPKEQEEIENEM